MPERVTFYVGEPITALLEQAGADNRSRRLNAVVQRYSAIVAEELSQLRFTRNEWCAICDANNGTMMDDDIGWRHPWANVWDAGDELDEKWEIDRESLVRRMRALNLAGQAAITEVVERFWDRSRQQRTPETHTEALRAAGVQNLPEEAAA